MRKQIQHIPQKGMNKDLSISKFTPEFTYDNYNIRFNSNEDNSLFTMTNEKGNVKAITDIEILGTTIGYSIINGYLVLFTTTRESTTELIGNAYPSAGIDRIYRINKGELFNGETNFDLEAVLLFEGIDNESLNFSKESLLETLPIFESNEIQKIYWIDKYNQPRFINVVSSNIGNFTNNSFEFCPELDLKESFNTTKLFSGGQFHSGTIQYVFTYWNKNGIETNIFLQTDNYTTSYNYRGGSPEETVICSYQITINNIQKDFDFIRMYAISRTSIDATPNVRIVKDINISDIINNSYTFSDDGIIGSTFNANSLLFIGGEEVILGSMSYKDNTLFGSNIKLKRPSLQEIKLKTNINYPDSYNTIFKWSNDKFSLIQQYDWLNNTVQNNINGVYIYNPYTLNEVYNDNSSPWNNTNYNLNIRHWKKGETYRLGIQAQYKTGIWSEVLYLGDYTVDTGYKVIVDGYDFFGKPSLNNDTTIYYTTGNLTITNELINIFINKGFKKIRPVYVPLNLKDRHILGQGILTNTIANSVQRGNNTPFAYSDYLARGNHELVPVWNANTYWHRYTNAADINVTLTYPQWQHFSLLKSYIGYSPNWFKYNEIKGSSRIQEGNEWTTGNNNDIDSLTNGSSGETSFWERNPKCWFIDSNLVNFWSPEIEFNNLNNNIEEIKSIIFRGSANITASSINNTSTINNGVKDSNTFSMRNFNIGASRVLSRFGVNSYDRGGAADWDNNFEVGYIWDSLKIEENENVQYLKKNLSRFIFCGFNDMFLDYDSNNIKISQYKLNINTPKYIDTILDSTNYNSNLVDGNDGTIIYNNKMDEVIGTYSDDASKLHTSSINYQNNKHLLFSFKNSKTLPIYSAGTISANSLVRTSYNRPYYRDNSTAGTFSTPTIDNNKYLGKGNNLMLDRFNFPSNLQKVDFKSGWPYFWIVDLYRDISNDSQYGGKDINAINQNTWIPAGNSITLNNNTLIFDRGDTYIQRYDILKTAKNNSDWQNYREVISVLLESFVNLDGRWDTKRGNTNITNYNIDNYTLINSIYSQKDNFFTSNTLDYNLLQSDDMPTTFLWSNTKIYSESIDSWTSLWMNNSYTVDGSLGKINALLNFNNELYGFQDKGIFQILFNSRVQVPTSDNNPIELTQSWKTQGIRYLSNTIGTTNKWSIKQSNKNLYFVDSLNKDIYILGTPPVNLSEQYGFKTWSYNNILNLNEYNLTNNKKAISTNLDIINDNLYFNNEDYSLMFSERLNQFESFYSYEDITHMFNIWGEFIAIKDEDNKSTLWVNHKGRYNEFFGKRKSSHIEFYLNPDMPHDKVFDNFQYRADLFDENDNYIPRETFNSVDVTNEFQSNSKTLMTTTPGFGAKKFRIWSYPFPRQSNSLNRIRNPWVKLKFNLENDKYRKLLFHDLIITYTV